MLNNHKQVVIALSPLSKTYQINLVSKLGFKQNDIDIYDLGTLRRLGFKELFSKLRSLKSNRLFLVYEEPNAKSLIPILGCLAFLSRSKHIYILNEKVDVSRFPRYRILGSIISLLLGSVLAHINLFCCYIDLMLLRHKKQILINKDVTKNILYLKTNLWYGVQIGGSIGHISGVVNSFIKREYDVSFVSMETPIMLDSKVKKIQLPIIKKYGLPQEVNLYTFQRLITRFFSQDQSLLSQKFSFVYSRMAIANYANVVISRRLKIPLILEYNGSEVWVSQKWGSGLRYTKVAQMAEDICLMHSHLIVVVSQVLKDQLIERGISKDKILFYPNCIDPIHFNPTRFSIEQITTLREEYSLGKDTKVITFIGTFGQWHGADKLAQAINLLCKNNRDWLVKNRVHFMLIGDGIKMSDVKSFLVNDYCKDFVTLTGLIPQKDAALHLAMSDILVSPHVPNSDGSKFFGSPTKLFEYMGMGKAIIASDLDQIGDILKNSLHIDRLPNNKPNKNNNELALLVRPGEINDLVKAIFFLVENDEWRQVLGNNVCSEAMNKYTWDKHVYEILEKYSDLLNKK